MNLVPRGIDSMAGLPMSSTMKKNQSVKLSPMSVDRPSQQWEFTLGTTAQSTGTMSDGKGTGR
jgi:hypothetical protein